VGSFVLYCMIPIGILGLIVFVSYKAGVWSATHRVIVERRDQQPVRLAAQKPSPKERSDPVGYGTPKS